jgi:ribosomal protein S18 acetylase RimI-like enzyme
MSHEYTTRIATTSDVDLLRELGVKTFSDTFREFNTPENMRIYLMKNFSRQQIEEEVTDPAGEFLLVYDGDVCVGYARMRTSKTPNELVAPAVEIERLYAVKEYIGKNVGGALMNSCLARAKEKKFKTVWLGVWEKNIRAIRFYEKYGFAKFGDHIFMLGDDAQTDWLMKKNVA